MNLQNVYQHDANLQIQNDLSSWIMLHKYSMVNPLHNVTHQKSWNIGKQSWRSVGKNILFHTSILPWFENSRHLFFQNFSWLHVQKILCIKTQTMTNKIPVVSWICFLQEWKTNFCWFNSRMCACAYFILNSNQQI